MHVGTWRCAAPSLGVSPTVRDADERRRPGSWSGLNPLVRGLAGPRRRSGSLTAHAAPLISPCGFIAALHWIYTMRLIKRLKPFRTPRYEATSPSSSYPDSYLSSYLQSVIASGSEEALSRTPSPVCASRTEGGGPRVRAVQLDDEGRARTVPTAQ
ncbi:hypothetical protein PYCCODRAFT_1440410 [Trametes coccinea BRFM310]|uniref:Uncharacterized protein n=1 Tax=Trametes coccinea (strain BRFM310) TaxID=1353009 RepID=A0A1Y2I7V6_TRAC3|nr:hypothetical protein PYCCODRAFT_1440410 [Trametes coccinea BRFM310]